MRCLEYLGRFRKLFLFKLYYNCRYEINRSANSVGSISLKLLHRTQTSQTHTKKIEKDCMHIFCENPGNFVLILLHVTVLFQVHTRLVISSEFRVRSII